MVMVGEIRDSETAEIAIRAALTGHQVFSTLHTNDAAGAVTRLDGHGRGSVPDFLLAGRRAGATAGPPDLSAIVGSKPLFRKALREKLEALGAGRINGKFYTRHRMRGMPRNRLSRTNRNFRIAGHRSRAAGS